jgi:hypothetical protein
MTRLPARELFDFPIFHYNFTVLHSTKLCAAVPGHLHCCYWATVLVLTSGISHIFEILSSRNLMPTALFNDFVIMGNMPPIAFGICSRF